MLTWRVVCAQVVYEVEQYVDKPVVQWVERVVTVQNPNLKSPSTKHTGSLVFDSSALWPMLRFFICFDTCLGPSLSLLARSSSDIGHAAAGARRGRADRGAGRVPGGREGHRQVDQTLFPKTFCFLASNLPATAIIDRPCISSTAVPVDVVREVEVPVQQKRQQIQQRQVSSSFSYADDDDDRWFDCILLQPIASPSNCPRDDDDPATLFVITGPDAREWDNTGAVRGHPHGAGAPRAVRRQGRRSPRHPGEPRGVEKV
eukprot:314213-Rhodomonas_salina.5